MRELNAAEHSLGDQFGSHFEERHSEGPRFHEQGEESRANHFKLTSC